MTKKKTHSEYENELFYREATCFPIEQYVNSKVPILHECIFGHQWKASPSNILANKKCPYCIGNAKKTTKDYQQIISFKVLEEYINEATPILHECVVGHQWKVKPNNILSGKQGCPECAKSGFKRKKPATLYFVSFETENSIFYKIGITNRTPYKRLGSDWFKFQMKELWSIKFQEGEEAEKLEKKLKLDHSNTLYNTGLLLSGNTETFTKKITKPVDL